MSKVFACLCAIMLVCSGMAFAVGGEDIATATAIGALPYADSDDTTLFVDNYDEVCPYGPHTTPDAVYAYAAGADGGIDISLCGSSYDTKLFVYENVATPGAPHACNDDACSLQSELLGVPVTAGNTYYIVVDGYSGATGVYTLAVDAAAGGSCDDDLVDLGDVVCGTPTLASGDTLGANNWCGNAAGDAHYSFNALVDGEYVISLCNGTTAFDTYLRLYDDACCGNSIATSDDSCGAVSEITTTLTAGTYYVHVEGYSANEGLFDLDITCTEIVATCDDVLVDLGDVVCGTPTLYSGDTTGADNYCGNASGDAHFSFNALVDEDYTISLCNGATGFDTYLTLYNDACCGTIIATNDDFCGLISEITATLTAGTYYVKVDGYSANEGLFDLDITCSTAPCIGPDNCALVEALAIPSVTAADTTNCTDDNPSSNLWGWSLLGADHVYEIDVTGLTGVTVVYTPADGQDGAIYLSPTCVDGAVTDAIVGADDTLSGDVEAFCWEATGGHTTLYLYVDTYGAGSAGAYTLEVMEYDPVPADTFDLTMTCDPAVVALDGSVYIDIGVTNTSAFGRYFCGEVGVTLCNGSHLVFRSGYLTLMPSATQSVKWRQKIPALGTTCNCDLDFDVVAWDCTPCAESNGVAAGWVETTGCTVTTVCP